MITRNDYTFAESEADDHWAVRLHSEFPGVMYMYGQIKVKEKEDIVRNELSGGKYIRDLFEKYKVF